MQYLDNPQDYSSHPATFITQHSTVDENADLCAGLNYHREMLAHGGRSQINLIAPKLGAPRPEELKALKHLMWGGDEGCYCMGQSGEPAANGAADQVPDERAVEQNLDLDIRLLDGLQLLFKRQRAQLAQLLAGAACSAARA